MAAVIDSIDIANILTQELLYQQVNNCNLRWKLINEGIRFFFYVKLWVGK